jgi:hypothetical protein
MSGAIAQVRAVAHSPEQWADDVAADYRFDRIASKDAASTPVATVPLSAQSGTEPAIS